MSYHLQNFKTGKKTTHFSKNRRAVQNEGARNSFIWKQAARGPRSRPRPHAVGFFAASLARITSPALQLCSKSESHQTVPQPLLNSPITAVSPAANPSRNTNCYTILLTSFIAYRDSPEASPRSSHSMEKPFLYQIF